MVEKGAGTLIAAGVRVWMALLVLPLAFGLIAVRLVWRASPRPLGRLLAGAGLAVGLWIGQFPGLLQGKPLWPGLAILGLATALGGPLFALLGGAAVWLFLGAGEPIAAVPVETYRLTIQLTRKLPPVPMPPQLVERLKRVMEAECRKPRGGQAQA